MYSTGLDFEFYRTRHELEARVELRPLAHMPKEGPGWLCAALIRLGEMLIATGNKLKNQTRPTSAVFSQETL